MSEYSDLTDELDQGFADVIIPEKVKGRVLHIDGDILAYQCAGNDDTPLAIARGNLVSRIDNMRIFSGSERAVVHITDARSDKGRRYKIAKTWPYQEQRTHSKRPKNWAGLRMVLEEMCVSDPMHFISHEFAEADDGLNIAAWEGQAHDPNLVVIASMDKDLRQSPGWYLHWDTNELIYRQHSNMGKLLYTDPDLAAAYVESAKTLKHGTLFGGIWFLLYQMLYGDSTDNIPGLQKAIGPTLFEVVPDFFSKKVQDGKEAPPDKPVGPALAAKILAKFPQSKPSQAYAYIKKLYQANYGEKEGITVFTEQWQLLGLFINNSGARLALATQIRDGKFDYEVENAEAPE